MCWSKACFPFRMPYLFIALQSVSMTSIEGVMITLQATNTGIGNSSSSTTVPVEGGPFRSQGKLRVPLGHSCFWCEQWPVDPGDLPWQRMLYTHPIYGELFWPRNNASPNEWGFYASCHDSFLVMKLPVVTLIHQGNPRWGNSLFDGFPIKESLSIVKTDNTTGIELSIYIISEKLQKTYQSK